MGSPLTPLLSAAVQDLGLHSDTLQKTQDEIDEAKRRKKALGASKAMPMGSAAVMSLTGNQY
jgi:hypothetical protein